MPREPFALGRGPLRIVPICHYRMEFAWAARQAVHAFRPACLALELPPALGPAFERAVRRLPFPSVLTWTLEGGETLHLPIEPADPLVEAARTAQELSIPIYFVDLAVAGYPEQRDPLPDSATLGVQGLEGYWAACLGLPRPPRAPQDALREAHMAARAQTLAQEGETLLICGIAHVRGILEALAAGSQRIQRQHPVESVTLAAPDLDSLREISAEPGFFNLCYELHRGGPAPPPVDPPTPPAAEGPEPRAEREAGPLDGLTGAQAVQALESLLGLAGSPPERPAPLTPEQRRAVARYLASLKDPGLRLPGQEPPPAPTLEGAPPAPAGPRAFTFRAVHDRRAELVKALSEWIHQTRAEDGFPDRQALLARLFELAGAHYEENTGEAIRIWQKRTLRQFAGTYARLTGQLLPDLYQCLVSARSAVDDNYAYEVWDLATCYPWTRAHDELPPIRIRAGEIWLDGVKTVRFRRRLPRLRERAVPMPIRRRPQEGRPGDWLEAFRQGSLCSYPPEDLLIEDFGRHLSRRALQRLAEEHTRTGPFSSQLLDGVDMRETLRHWGATGEIHVKEVRRIRGGAGAVVVIFDEDPEDRRYPWQMAWHGEHEQESDMAFYATPASARIVGPGIARCEYGGLMLTGPPGRIMDVWGDPLYAEARSKPEVLLMAALDYAQEPHVIYVASRPPRSWFRGLAGKLGRKLVYLPLGQLSPVTLKKLRIFHVLSGRQVREIARDYLW